MRNEQRLQDRCIELQDIFELMITGFEVLHDGGDQEVTVGINS